MILRGVAATVCCLAGAAHAQVSETRVHQLVALICENGGSMETSEAARILPQEGFSMKETQGSVAFLEQRVHVIPTTGMGTLKLSATACQ